MLSPQALIRGIVQRALPTINADSANSDVAVRQWSYGEIATQPMIRKNHALADEGSYYVMGTTSAIAPTYGTSQVATSPLITIYNGNPSGGPRVYLDYIALTTAVALVCTTAIGYSTIGLVIDNINRYTSGGTVLSGSINNVNMLAPQNNSNVAIAVGAITAPAASASARTIVGSRTIRPGLSTTVGSVIGDLNLFNFGGVESAMNGSISVTASVPNIIPMSLPPIVLAPGCSALLYIWYPVLTAPSAATYVPEIGFWVR